ncbi:DUF2635 domain-containing protein [Pluralibacter gergoviae]|uniref:DUF2635 domain-containing protein n=1 Tax=Pluralibacter gergoviae TaxID=61647 RepID=UPI0007DABA22|nr:DUF2635 domain-containing protein [Pluralibacter gergoviae]SUB71398.1 Protein of uncharacterised function (DUF2635) [Pluralibacter gergoviae]
MKKHIKPAREGLNVRKPDGLHLSPAGEPLEVTAFWLRRQTEGDVVITTIQPATENTPAESRPARLVKEK